MHYRCVICDRMVALDDVELRAGHVSDVHVVCLSCIRAMVDAVPRMTPEQQADILREYGIVE